MKRAIPVTLAAVLAVSAISGIYFLFPSNHSGTSPKPSQLEVPSELPSHLLDLLSLPQRDISAETGFQYHLSGSFILIGKDGFFALDSNICYSGSFVEGDPVPDFALRCTQSPSLLHSADMTKVYINGGKVCPLGKDVEVSVFGELEREKLLTAANFADSFSRSEGFSGWRIDGGRWTISSAPDPDFSVEPFHVTAHSDSPASLLTGEEFFTDYIVRASVGSTAMPSSFGVGAALGTEKGIVARFSPERGWYGTLRLEDVASGKVYFERPMKADPHQWYEFALAIQGGRAFFSIDGYLLCEVDVPYCAGEAGLFLSGGSALFDDVFIAPVLFDWLRQDHSRQFNRALRTQKLADSYIPLFFTKDRANYAWANVSADWNLSRNFGGRKLTFNESIRLPMSLLADVDNSAEMPSRLVLNALDDSKLLELDIRSSSPCVVKAILKGGESENTEFEVSERSFPLEFRLDAFEEGQRTAFYLSLAGQTRRVAILDATGILCSLTFEVGFDNPDRIQLWAANHRSYSFATAPTDFHSLAGDWFVSSRWACSPQYSWLGGRAEPYALLATKFDLIGDFSLRCATAPLMREYMRPGYRHPGTITFEFSPKMPLIRGSR
ncbi:MAG: hypothetical protein U5N86_11810 [Planctomycetota bacterium]|nr:hypothetical protein [Planctomycetota bacterium]